MLSLEQQMSSFHEEENKIKHSFGNRPTITTTFLQLNPAGLYDSQRQILGKELGRLKNIVE